MNGVAREFWREVLDLHTPLADLDKRPRRRGKEVRVLERQKVAKDHRLGSR
jgi:hypothetical protein